MVGREWVLVRCTKVQNKMYEKYTEKDVLLVVEMIWCFECPVFYLRFAVCSSCCKTDELSGASSIGCLWPPTIPASIVLGLLVASE